MKAISYTPARTSRFGLTAILTLIVAVAAVYASDSAVVSSENDPVQLELRANRTLFVTNAESEIIVMATIRTGNRDGSPQPLPTELVVAVDQSGSMAGAADNAVREGLRQAIAALSDKDHVAIVSYGSKATVGLPLSPVDQARHRSLGLPESGPNGGSDLHSGLTLAARQFSPAENDERRRVLLLITDGPPTRPPFEDRPYAELARGLYDRGIQIRIIDMSNEGGYPALNVMANLPHVSTTAYAGEETIAGTIEECLYGGETTIAYDAELTIEFPYFARIKTDYSEAAKTGFGTANYQIGKLRAYNERSFLVSAMVPVPLRADTSFEIAEARLRYRPDLAVDAWKEVSLELEARAALDSQDSYESMDTLVMLAVSQAEVDLALAEADTMVNEGKQKRALRRIKRLDTELRILESDIDELDLSLPRARLARFVARQEAVETNSIEQRALNSTLYQSKLKRAQSSSLSAPRKPAATATEE